MPAVDYRTLAGDIIDLVGGESNVASVTHCATRLRLRLRDQSEANKAAVEALPGVITVVEAGGQFQIVIGDDVPVVYAEIGQISKLTEGTAADDDGPKGNLFNQFIDLISRIFQPILWTLAGLGLLKALLSLALTLEWLSPDDQTYVILNAASDAMFYFLPLFLAATAARRFDANQFSAMAIAGALVYPSIVALSEESAVYFLGVPVIVVGYTSSVLPIIVAVWVQSVLEKWLKRVLPSVIRNFTVPLVIVTVMVPLTLIVVGPITSYLSEWMAAGISWLFSFAPWLGGAILGGLWQVFVIFGLHWGLLPVALSELAEHGYSLVTGPLPAAVLAQGAATLAVIIRTRSVKRQQVAGPSALSAILAGITEPALYGVNLPLKRPFYFGLAGGAIGGAIAASGGSAANTFAVPSLLSLPTYLLVGSFPLQVIGIGVGMTIAFGLTFTCWVPDQPDEPEPEPGSPEIVVPGVSGASQVGAPVSGDLVRLSDVKDKVFASGALGNGVGVIPSKGQVYAPFAGTVATAFPTGHAFGIKSSDGVEVLIHIGIDTVQLDGKGFTAAVAQGHEVQAGDLLATVDLEAVRAAGYDPTTIVVITNTAQFAAVMPAEGHAVTHGDPLIVIER